MSILLESLLLRFGNNTVLDHVSLEVADGELLVLLGASGSGKSTILRIIAGLLEPNEGRVVIHDRDVTHLPPQERGTGFVFQNYSVFRHMTVSENVEFGLRLRGVPKEERRRRSEELLDLVGLAGLGRRYSDALSGGQRQRVALARALAYQPGVLLLDEPFAALDVKIRAQLRRTLFDIQRRLGITTILVTHDQEEGFELADRIGVLERGRLLEVGVPESLYHRPRTASVATFVGAGAVLIGRVREGSAALGPLHLPIPPDLPHEEGGPSLVLVRPEQVKLRRQPPPPGARTLGRGMVMEEKFSGAHRRVRLRVTRPPGTRQLAPQLPFGEERLHVEATLPARVPLEDREYWVELDGWQILEQPQYRVLLHVAPNVSEGTLSRAAAVLRLLHASATVLTMDAGANSSARLSERLEGAGLDPSTLIVRERPMAEAVLTQQSERFHDLVMVLEGETSVGTGALASYQALVDGSEAPVWFARSLPEVPRRILLCTAGGEPGKDDVRIGGRLAARLGAMTTLLYVTSGRDDPDRLTRGHLELALASLRSFDVSCELHLRPAALPEDGILDEARTGEYDLVVLGRQVSPEPVFFPSRGVTRSLLRKAGDVPLLVVPFGPE